MKNLFLFVLVFTLVFFASCTKEALIDATEDLGARIEQRSTTIELPVNKVVYSVVSGEMFVDFEATYDFTETILENTQYLKFTDSSGNESTLTFQTTSYTGSSDLLQTTFTVGANNLNGLSLLEVQEVIIEDTMID